MPGQRVRERAAILGMSESEWRKQAQYFGNLCKQGIQADPRFPCHKENFISKAGKVLTGVALAAVGGGALSAFGSSAVGSSFGFAPKAAADVAGVIYPTEATVSLFGDLGGLLTTGLDIYRTVQGGGGTQLTASTPMAMGALPALGRALPAIGAAAGGMVVRGASSVFRSAQTYCRRHPQWCATIGGTAAVGAMIESGQLPAIRRRRGRGLTPKDLRSFRRVASLIKGYCPTVRRVPTGKLRKC